MTKIKKILSNTEYKNKRHNKYNIDWIGCSEIRTIMKENKFQSYNKLLFNKIEGNSYNSV